MPKRREVMYIDTYPELQERMREFYICHRAGEARVWVEKARASWPWVLEMTWEVEDA